MFDELLEIQPALATINMPVSVIHGAEDSLVDFQQLEYAKRNLVQAGFRSVPVQDSGHFVLWEKPEIVVDEIIRQLDSQD